MIGNKVRGIRHLYNLTQKTQDGVRIFVVINTHTILEGVVFPRNRENSVVFVLQQALSHRYQQNVYDEIAKTHKKSFDKYINEHQNAYCYFCDDISHLLMSIGLGSFSNPHIIAVLDTFDSMYEEFKLQNKKMLSSIFGKYIMPQDSIAKLTFALSEGNAQFFSWAVKVYAKNNASIFALMHLFEFNENYGQLVKDITKGNLIALSSNKEIVKALGESFNLRATIIAKQSINWFNPIQKKVLRDALADPRAVGLLNNFSKLSKVKRINFIRKVSTIESAEEILQMMSFLCSHTHFAWNKQSFLDFIANVEGLKCEVVKNEGDTVVVRVHDYETMKRLGKTTNWCISKNRSYWENYMGHDDVCDMDEPFIEMGDSNVATDDSDSYDDRFYKLINERVRNRKRHVQKPIQYAIFDFSQPEDSVHSIVGVTVNPTRGITSAHNFVNDNMMGGGGMLREERNIEAQLFSIWRNDNSFTENVKSSNIKQFLSERKIAISDLFSYVYPCCKWDKNEVKELIAYYCDPNDYYIISESDDKLIIKTESRNISAILPSLETYDHSIEYDNLQNTIWCLDFTKPEKDLTKILFWHVYRNGKKTLDFTQAYPRNECGGTVQDITFSKFLKENNLPFNLIARPDTIELRIKTYAEQCEYDLMIDELANIQDSDISQCISDVVTNSISNDLDNTRLNIYSKLMQNNSSLVKIIGHNGILRLCSYLLKKIICYIDNDFWRKKSCFDNIPKTISIDEIIEASEKKWNDHLPTLNNTRSRNYFAKELVTATNAQVYNKLLHEIVEDAEKSGFNSVYNKVIPQFIQLMNSCGFLNADNGYLNASMVDFVHQFVINNKDKWTEISLNNVNVLFILLKVNNCEEFVFHRLEEILSQKDLKAKHISRLITELENVRNCTSNNRASFKKAFDMICQKGMERHLVSESTVEQMAKIYR